MLKQFRQAFLEKPNPVKIISGNNKPSVILVDLVCSKILMNLDNIDYKETKPGKEVNGSISFTWKVDDIVVAGAQTLTVRYIMYDTGGGFYTRDRSKDHFTINPQIKINSVQHTLTENEQKRLWETMVKAGRMKIQRDKETAEYNRQRAAVDAIANLGDRESDIVKRAKELSQQALLKLSPPEKSREEEFEERLNS